MRTRTLLSSLAWASLAWSSLAGAVFAAAPHAVAQDMIGLSWSGQAYLVDSYTGSATSLGSTGRGNINAMAADGRGRLWASDRSTSTSGDVYTLGTVDPVSGAVTPLFPGTPDFRGLAGGEADSLWGVVDASPDELHVVDTRTGTSTLVGPTGFSGIQGLAAVGNELFAWDIHRGLVRLDRSTGAGTLVNGAISGTGDIQFLAVRGDGQLIGGGNSGVYAIDATTGAYTLLGMTGVSDLRGAENLRSAIVPYGAGCMATHGIAALSVTGSPLPGQAVTSTSTNHASGSFGIVVLGFSTVSHGGTALPFSVDSLLGTSGCAVLCSPDATYFGMTSASAPGTLAQTFAIPASLPGLQFYVQHAVYEGGAREWSWTNGVAVQVGY